MKGFFNFDSPLMRFLTRVADLMLISLFCLLGCIPVFTAGAAIAAAHKVLCDIHHQEDSGIILPLLAAFRNNFKQATIGWLIYLLTFAFLVLDYLLIHTYAANRIALVLYLLLITVTVLVFANMCYFFPLLSRYQNTLSRHLYNSFLLTIGELPRTLALVILQLSPVILCLVNLTLFINSMLVWILVGFGLIIYLQQWLLKPLFAKLEK